MIREQRTFTLIKLSIIGNYEYVHITYVIRNNTVSFFSQYPRETLSKDLGLWSMLIRCSLRLYTTMGVGTCVYTFQFLIVRAGAS